MTTTPLALDVEADTDQFDEERFRKAVVESIRRIIHEKQPSAEELLEELESMHGWRVRWFFRDMLVALRADADLKTYLRRYLVSALDDDSLTRALIGGAPRVAERSSLDALFQRSAVFRESGAFAEVVRFVARLREYSPYNNFLVRVQNPATTYYATEKHWNREFRREVKDDARGMLILAPKTPVLLVYDVEDTDGPPLPERLRNFAVVDGDLDSNVMEQTLENASRDGILVEFVKLSRLKCGYATNRVRRGDWKMRIAIHEGLGAAERYAVLCHELAHIFLGHLGADADLWWPCRVNLTQGSIETEAEATAFIVCRRLGLATHSAEYVAIYLQSEEDRKAVSLDWITRVAGRIEEMGKRKLPPRK